jgi:hypothetical protein
MKYARGIEWKAPERKNAEPIGPYEDDGTINL